MPPQAATDSGKIEYTYEPCEPGTKWSKFTVAASASIGGGGYKEIQPSPKLNKKKEIHMQLKLQNPADAYTALAASVLVL